jgi:K+-transporting ATPase ATPase B chain
VRDAAFLSAAVGVPLGATELVALFVCLIPTTIGGLLPAIGIAGMDRALRANVLAKSGKAVEVAGDVDVLLLDKTGTITVGARQATRFLPLPGVPEARLRRGRCAGVARGPDPRGPLDRRPARAAGSSRRCPPAPRSRRSPRARGCRARTCPTGGSCARARAPRWPGFLGGELPADARRLSDEVARDGGTPLVVDGRRVLGVVALTDVLKPGIKERFARLRAMGIRTVMITGDNPLTAAAIAAEAGVDGFLAEATPEDKLARIREEQANGVLVAMMGDGTNDAPALAQADLGLAMNAAPRPRRRPATWSTSTPTRPSSWRSWRSASSSS